jgi:hypothetical protein
MEFDEVIKTINKLLSKKQPPCFNSSWIRENSPRCYSFIQRNVRTHVGTIDWDKLTYALEWKFQRRWSPGHYRKNIKPYRDGSEVKLVLRKNKKKLYVFVAPQNLEDRRARDIISISLVRLAQNGNLSAKKELMKLLNFTVNEWLYNYYFLNRWQGYKDELQKQIEDCIRRYRYTGSFLHYVFRTLEYAGRGIRPFYAYSLDKPVAWDAKKTIIENVVADPETGRAKMYDSANYTDFLE